MSILNYFNYILYDVDKCGSCPFHSGHYTIIVRNFVASTNQDDLNFHGNP